MFYDLFHALCVKKGVTPSKACLDMGLSRSLAAKWKNTRAMPSADVISKIADYFGVSVDDLFERNYPKNVEVFDKETGKWVPQKQPEQKKDALNEDVTFDDFTYALYDETKDLTDEDRELLLDMARTLKARLKKKEEK